jgi:alcohol dehydrogenase
MDRRNPGAAATLIKLPSMVTIVDDIATQLGPAVRASGSRAVVVSEQVLVGNGLVRTVSDALDADVVSIPGGEPVGSSVSALAKQLARGSADVVVAVGGGSVIDTVKLAARLVADPDGLDSRLLSAAPFPPGLKVVAVPTTAGSGAEVTRTAIVSRGARKSWAWDEVLRPDLAVLAPDLTLGLPRSITVASGLDAFAHAVEAATGQRATPAVVELGMSAARSISARLPEVVANPGNRSGRRELLIGATAAGLAIDECGTGIGHALGHALGSLVKIPHGLAVMLGLRAGLEWTLERADDRYAPIYDAMSSRDLSVAFDELLDRVGFDEELSKWLPPTESELVAELACVEHQPMCRNNARPIAESDHAMLAHMTVGWWSR